MSPPIIVRLADGQEVEVPMTKAEFEAAITGAFVVISETEWISIAQISRVEFPLNG